MFGPKNYDRQKIGQHFFVKIKPITAEIMMIWTNVAMAYMFPWQMSLWQLASFKHGPKILDLKFGLNLVSNNWD